MYSKTDTMEWLNNLVSGQGVAHSIIIIALTITAGLLCDRIKIRGVKLGVTWILFIGIFLGQLGFTLDPTTCHFVKEFGLILFVYSIGLEVGPHFFSSFKSGGVTLNLLATGIVLLGTVTAYLIHVVTGEDLFAMTGVLYGSVTNTPGLGAAQQTFSDLNEGLNNEKFACGYAVAYPMGVMGIVLSVIFIRVVFRISLDKEQRHDTKIDHEAKAAVAQKIESPDVGPVFLGIMLGVLLGSIPIFFPGMSVPVKLGLAGGPLIVSILISAFSAKVGLRTGISPSANLMMRQVGICLFIAAVGISAGDGFIETIMDGGYWWILYAFIISTLPLLLVAAFARLVLHMNYFAIIGMIAGATTDPPALAYANSICESDEAAVAYSTVYPLSMFLRILAAQVLVLIA